MVICGPCMVMMPTNGAFQKKETRIPLPNNRTNTIQESAVEYRRNLSKLPQVTPSTSKQEDIVRRPPSTSNNYRYSYTENRVSANVNSKYTPNFKGDNSLSTLPKYEPRRAESLVLSDKQGKYVGTKPVKPINTSKSGLYQPSVHSISKQDSKNNLQLSSKLPMRKLPTIQNTKAISSPSTTANGGVGNATFRHRDGPNKCMSYGKHQPTSVHSRDNISFSPQSTSFTNKTSTRLTPCKTDNKFVQISEIEPPATVFRTKRTVSTLPRRVNNTTSITNTSRHSLNGINLNGEELYRLGEKFHTRSSRELKQNTQRSKNNLEFNVNRNLAYKQQKQPLCNYILEDSQYTNYSAKTEETARPSKEAKHSQRVNKMYELDKDENKGEFEELCILDESEDMLDFSIASGEDLAYEEECLLESKTVDLVEDEYDSDEGTTSQDMLTVIDTGVMERSDDTILDASFHSSEENILESLPEIDSIEEEEEEEEQEQFRLNSEISSHLSADQFLVQSFEKLQKQIEENQFKEESELKDFKSEFLNILNDSRCQNSSEDSRRESISLPKLDSLSEDESDYIDIDCDVQPMPPLKRPLVYGYGERLPVRARNIYQESKHSFNLERVRHNVQLPGESCFPPKTVPRKTSVFPSNFKETYWDYYLAKSKNKEIDRIGDFQSVADKTEKLCYGSNELLYDPEILLAQVVHPKSLENATFSEYSSHIKSSIMERCALHYSDESIQPNNDIEYGSCIDLFEKSQQVSSNDPGYYSESDIMKLKKNKSQTQMVIDSENEEDEFDDYYPSYPSLSLHTRQSGSEAITKDPFSYQHQSKATYGCMNDTDKNVFSYSNYTHPFNSSIKTIGENPWLHLLLDITPPRTPLRELLQTRSEDEEIISHSPSVVSLPVWTSSDEYGNDTERKHRRNDDIRRSDKEKTSSLSSLMKIVPNVKKNEKKSFLPTFFRKRNRTSKSNDQISSKSKIPQNFEELRPRSLPPSKASPDLKKRTVSSDNTYGNKQKLYSHLFASPRLAKKSNESLTDSVTVSEKSNSSSSSSSSTKSNRSASSQDSILTIIAAKCS